MSEKGFGIKEVIILIIIIFGALAIIVGIFSSLFTKEVKQETKKEIIEEKTVTYETLENKLKSAAERYQNNNYSGSADTDEVWSLSYDLLRESGYLNKIKDIKDKKECTGYVKFIKNKAKITYEPYLKCSNYKTEGYENSN